MADQMLFPDTVEEFMKQYKIVDTEGIYMSKGSELVPIFRMKQWFEHKPERKTGKWIEFPNHNAYKCSECGRVIETTDGKRFVYKHFPFCHCGAKMEGEEHGQDD